MDWEQWLEDNWKKLGVIVGVLLLLAVLAYGCFVVVGQRERGIKYVFGKVEGEVIQPGLHMKAPFVSKIKKYSIVPKTYEVIFSVGSANDSAAITKDMQSVGATVNIKYQFDENRIMEIATKYGDSNIENTMRPIIQSAVKEVLGKYSIYDIPTSQSEISSSVSDVIMGKMTAYPVLVNAVAITNFTWSEQFEKSIEATAQAAQEAKRAEQELKLAETNAQRQVVEAEAKKNAMAQEAEAIVIKAENDAKAKRAEADALEYYNNKVAQNYQVEIKLKELEIELERAKRWNGIEVSQYVPLTAAGGVVTLPTN